MNSRKSFISLSFILMLSFFSTQSFSQDPNFHIYLCFGQSNMEGQGVIQSQDKEVNDRFKVFQSLDCSNLSRTKGEWYTATPPLAQCYSKLSPADYFGRTMVANLPDSITIGVINVAVGGCDIRLFDKDIYQDHDSTYAESWFTNKVEDYGWNPYQHLIELALQAQQDGVIKGFLLHQGETNTGDTKWPLYVNKIYNDMLSDLSLEASATPILAGEVVSIEGNCCESMNEIINKLPESIDNSYIISSESLTAMDNAHFDSEGYRIFGRRYAVQMLSIMGHESINLEAECSLMGENLIIVENEDASNNAYVSIRDASESMLDGSLEPSFSMTFDFSAASNTTYYAYGRFNNESSEGDAIWFKVNDNDAVLFNDLDSDGWEWKSLGNYVLKTGEQSVSISITENNVKLDKLVMKNTEITPVDVAEEADNLCTPELETTSIRANGKTEGFLLGQNYPNPFNGKTSILFEIPSNTYVSLKLYNIMGIEVAELAGKEYQLGKHTIEFNSDNLPKGTYFYTINAGDNSATNKMILLPE